MLTKQFISFLFVGSISVLVNIVTRIVYSLYFNFYISIFLAFFTALSTAFILNKFFIFKKSIYGNWLVEYWYFFLVNIVGLIQTIIIGFILIKYLLFTELSAHVLGVIFPVFTSFLGHKYFSFKE